MTKSQIRYWPAEDIRWMWVGVFAASAILFVSFHIQETSLGYDGAQYLRYAENIVENHAFSYDGVNPSSGRAPGYPTFLALFISLGLEIDWVYPAQYVLLLLTYIPVALAAGRTSVSSAALLVLLTAVWPVHRVASTLMSEPLFLAVTSWGLYLVLRYCKRRGRFDLVLAGVLLGVSSLVRPVNLLAPVFLSGVLVWRHLISFRGALLFTAASIFVIAPWTVRNWNHFDRLVPIASHHGSIYYMTDAEVFWPVLLNSAGYTHTLPIHKEIVGDDLELDWEANERYWKYARNNIAEDPIGFIKRCIMKSVFVWSYFPGTKGWASSNLPLFLIGVVLRLSFLIIAAQRLVRLAKTDPALAFVVAGYATYTAGVLFPFYSESRMLLPVDIWLFSLVSLWILDELGRATSLRQRISRLFSTTPTT